MAGILLYFKRVIAGLEHAGVRDDSALFTSMPVSVPRSAPAPASSGRPEPWVLAAQVIVLILAGFFVYGPVLHGEWLWDDGFTLRDNPLMHDSVGWWKIWFAPPGPDFFPL